MKKLKLNFIDNSEYPLVVINLFNIIQFFYVIENKKLTEIGINVLNILNLSFWRSKFEINLWESFFLLTFDFKKFKIINFYLFVNNLKCIIDTIFAPEILGLNIILIEKYFKRIYILENFIQFYNNDKVFLLYLFFETIMIRKDKEKNKWEFDLFGLIIK